jgi:hypothetical protein
MMLNFRKMISSVLLTLIYSAGASAEIGNFCAARVELETKIAFSKWVQKENEIYLALNKIQITKSYEDEFSSDSKTKVIEVSTAATVDGVPTGGTWRVKVLLPSTAPKDRDCSVVSISP